MALTPREAAVFCVLLMCVPLQLWMCQWNTQVSSSSSLLDSLLNVKVIIQSMMSPAFWVLFLDSAKNSTSDYSSIYFDDKDPEGECPAAEVFKHKNPKEFFASSPIPRRKRIGVKYRVGQVVHHKTQKFNGVIAGWDRVFKAPETWSEEMKKNGEFFSKSTPYYVVLVGQRGGRGRNHVTYLPEESIELVKEKILHPSLTNYFTKFDGEQYIMQPWLRALYPRD